MAKQQLNLYLDPDEHIESMILNHINTLPANRQQYIRDLLRLGYMSHEAGFLIHKGELKHEGGFTSVTNLIAVAEPVKLQGPAILGNSVNHAGQDKETAARQLPSTEVLRSEEVQEKQNVADIIGIDIMTSLSGA